MRKYLKKLGLLLFAVIMITGADISAQAKEENRIKEGIYISGIDVSGMTETEAEEAVSDYTERLKPTIITLQVANGEEVQTTAGDLGLTWTNREIVKEAVAIGQEGNVIARYKVMKDLQYDNITYDLEFRFEEAAILQILTDRCVKYDSNAVNASLARENGKFIIKEGVSGFKLAVEESAKVIRDHMQESWDHKPCDIVLVIREELPKGSKEELEKVQDVLGTFTTSYSTSGTARSANVVNGTRLISNITLYPGEEFSMLEEITPFSTANGYYMAASYSNGKVVDSLGGGICQVSTTLYNAVLRAELDVTERYNHSMIVAYVDPAADAAIAESAGKDFKFVNNTEYPIYIEGITKDKKVTVTIYGVDSRGSNRKVSYVSEVLEVINPGPDVIYTDASKPIGYLARESAHVGYKAKLWKVVTVDGKEVERSQVNSSSYKMTPRYATVGTATSDPNAYNEIMAAIGTANIDHVQNVIHLLTAPTQVPTE